MTISNARLPINLDDLPRQRSVERDRIECKAVGWNPDAIIRALCAFASDFADLGGGYVVIGQDCDAKPSIKRLKIKRLEKWKEMEKGRVSRGKPYANRVK
jgi:hypothetical protein